MTEPILIDRRKLFEQVAEHLEKDILSGKLRPGESLPPERDLQTMFGVGRPAIREALITLQRAGLIEIGNGAPARVARPNMRDVVAGLMPAVHQVIANAEGQKQLQGVRVFMEVGLVRNAAENATNEDLELLQKALKANKEAIGNATAFAHTDIAFHRVFAEITRNSAFLVLHDAMSDWLREQRRIALMEKDEDKAGYRAHAKIYAAVEAHDPDAAERAMREHLESGAKAFWKRYAEPAQS
jgi:GntR family transcriptional repressor for pyruvate dehydrogenase complex